MDDQWEPTEDDVAAYDRACDELNAEGGCIGTHDIDRIYPLYAWRKLVTHEMKLPPELELELEPWVASFYEGMRKRYRWYYAQLLAATEGMPQAQRRRMTIA